MTQEKPGEVERKQWGKTNVAQSCTRRGLIQLGKLKAEVVISGAQNQIGKGFRYRYELSLPGGRSSRSLYTFSSMPDAQAEAEVMAAAMLAVLSEDS